MKRSYVFNCVIIFTALAALFACSGKHKFKDIFYTVTVTPLVDSLPCKTRIDWPAGEWDLTDTHWKGTHKCRIDTNTELLATGMSNVKSIEVKI